MKLPYSPSLTKSTVIRPLHFF